MSRQFDAVLFDLLSALLDSWSLWDDVAGDATLGREWRRQCLAAASRTARYEPYISLVEDSAAAVGLPRSRADLLAGRWNELTPWPETVDILAEIAAKTKIGVITNCSEQLGVMAAEKTGVDLDVVLTAERAGYYKPDFRVYEMAIREVGEAPERILYVAGSPYDVCGASAAGLPVHWHNRVGLVDSEASSRAASSSDTLACVRNLTV